MKPIFIITDEAIEITYICDDITRHGEAIPLRPGKEVSDR